MLLLSCTSRSSRWMPALVLGFDSSRGRESGLERSRPSKSWPAIVSCPVRCLPTGCPSGCRSSEGADPGAPCCTGASRPWGLGSQVRPLANATDDRFKGDQLSKWLGHVGHVGTWVGSGSCLVFCNLLDCSFVRNNSLK